LIRTTPSPLYPSHCHRWNDKFNLAATYKSYEKDRRELLFHLVLLISLYSSLLTAILYKTSPEFVFTPSDGDHP
jgi:hypothetical protein